MGDHPAFDVEELALLGRDEELQALRQVVDEARTGAGRIALVEGEAGIGKSRLLAEVLSSARRDGLPVLYGAADEVERDRPFRPWVEALRLGPSTEDDERAELWRLVAAEDPGSWSAPMPGAPPSDLGFRIIDAMVALLERLAARGPLVLVLEDLHWADASTLRALRRAARSLPQLPIALLATLRPVPRPQELDRALGELDRRGARHLVLGPVTEAQVAALAAAVSGAPPGPRLRRRLAGTRGNPLFVIELVRACRDEGMLHPAGGRVDVDEVSLPPTLGLTLLRRIGSLPGPTLEILKVASVIGRRFPVAQLAAVMDRSPVQLLSALEDAMKAGMLGEMDGDLAFRHELIREVLYEDLPLALRRGLHREAARALGAAGAPLAQVAEHVFLGAAPGDAQARRWLLQGARQAVWRAPSGAVRLLERALELVSPDDPEADELASELAPLLIQTGRGATPTA